MRHGKPRPKRSAPLLLLPLLLLLAPLVGASPATAAVADTWTNVAAHAVVKASSTQGDSPASNAVNGIIDDDSDRWRTNSQNELHWLEIHLGDTYNIVGATFETGYSRPEWALQNMRLEYWDGADWTTIPGLEISGNTDISVTLNATTPIETNVVRFASDDATRGLRVREVLVYTDDIVDPVTPAEPTGAPAPVISHDPNAFSFPVDTPYRVEFTSSKELLNAEVLVMNDQATPDAALATFPLELERTDDAVFVYSGVIELEGIGANSYTIRATDHSGNVVKSPSEGGYSIVGRENTGPVDLPTTGFSVADGEAVSGTVPLYAYNETATAADAGTLAIDGTAITTDRSLPTDATFKFQGRSLDIIYQSAVSALDASGNFVEIGQIEDPVDSWYQSSIPADYLVEGEQQATIHTGNESVYYTLENHDEYFGVTNFDDFYVSNMHLELADYSVVKPSELIFYTGGLEVQTREYEDGREYLLADDGPPQNVATIYPMMIDVRFDVPADKLTAAFAQIDTTTLTDGVHTLTWEVEGVTESIEFVVDNHAPVIDDITWNEGVSLANDDIVKGNATFEVHTNEPGATVEAWLDGEAIEVPYEFSSLDLTQGEHELKIVVTDAAGNSTEEVRTFQIGEEHPAVTGAVSPADGATDVPVDSSLSVQVEDPNGDDLSVSFYEGQKFDLETAPDRISAFSHTADREPPLEISPDGETALSGAEQALVAQPDGESLVLDSHSGFPYHRFEVAVGEQPAGTEAEIQWQGSSLADRVVTLYAWSYEAEEWVALDSHIPASEDEQFELAADVNLDTFSVDGKIQALIQDQVLTSSDEFNILWSTDTQYYAKTYPGIFDELYSWIADEYSAGAFEYMIHTGDIVDNAHDPAQWEVANRNFDKLDDLNVPYGVLAGNHDVITDRLDYTEYGTHFGEDRFEHNPWYGGSMDNNRNHYDLVSFGGQDFIMLYIGFGTENDADTEAWANEVLETHSDRNAILNMHAYLESNGSLSNMSQQVYDNIIVPNENVKLVLSGHYHAATHNVKTLENADGSERTLVEILYDYQSGPNGGDGFIRMLNFDPEANTMSTETYSPITDEYVSFSPEQDEFTVPFEFVDPTKRVATDYFSVNVYGTEQIGDTQQVASGDTATVTPDVHFDADSEYFWYVRAVDSDGADVRSALFGFTTGSTVSATPGATPDETEPGETPDESSPDATPAATSPAETPGQTPTGPGEPVPSSTSGAGSSPIPNAEIDDELAQTGAAELIGFSLFGGALLVAGMLLALRKRAQS